MRWATVAFLRLRSLLVRSKVEAELDEEMRYHLERQIDENLNAGMTPADARHAALRSIAGIDQRKEECRDMRGLNLIDNAGQDFRYAVRQLAKSPGFTVTAVFVLALGISAAVSIFGLVEAALIKPLPYHDQASLVAVFGSSPDSPRSLLSYADFVDWRKLNHMFSSIDAYALNGGFTLSKPAGAEQVTGTRVSSGFFGTLGVRPMLGRDFYPAEDSPAAARAVMISYSAWMNRFGARADVLGSAVTLNGAPYLIIGVLPRVFHFAPFGAAEFWTTLRGSDSCEEHRECVNLTAIARLKAGTSLQTALADMQLVARRLQKEYPDSNRDRGATLAPLRDVIIGDVRPILLVMLSGAYVLLLIAFVNISTLLLARSAIRRREIAVRRALGASSSRLFRQFATEGLVLAVSAAAISLVCSQWGMRLLTSIVPEDKVESMPWLSGLELDPRMVALSCGMSLVAGAIFGVIPFLRTYLPDLTNGLKAGARGASRTMWRRFGANLLVAQMALATLLLVISGLLGKSLYLLLHVETGMRPDHLASMQVDWLPDRYTSDEQTVVLERRTLQAVAALPGVKSAAVSLTHPVGSDWGTTGFHVVGRPNRGEHNDVLNRQVSPAYFTTLQAHLIRGRFFTEGEDARMPRVAIVNRTLARKYFGGDDPVGKQIYYDWAPKTPMEVIGMVDDIKEGYIEAPNRPALYVPFDQNPPGMFTVLIRTSGDERGVIPEVAAGIHRIDRDLSVHDGLTMTERINGAPAAFLHRSSTWVVGSFAGIAFLLGMVGLYGVVSYSVSQRTREIGVRMALGAEPGSVSRLILSEAGRLVGAGAALGITGSLAAANLIRGLLYGVHSWDVPTLAASVTVLSLAALLASYIPARRAASVNPVEALRSE